jgi:HTH-type transcriptional regulator/antitoxin HigA
MAKKAIRPLRTDADYEAALAEIECYFENEPKRGTAEADRFDLLALVLDDYESKKWPIEPPGQGCERRAESRIGDSSKFSRE